MSKDLTTYKKLIKDQNDCIEQLHKSQNDDQIILRTLQKENKRLREQIQTNQSAKSTPNKNQMGYASMKSLVDRSENKTPVAQARYNGLISHLDHLQLNEQKKPSKQPVKTIKQQQVTQGYFSQPGALM